MMYANIHKYNDNEQTILVSPIRIGDDQIEFDIESPNELELVNGIIVKISKESIVHKNLSPLKDSLKDYLKTIIDKEISLGIVYQGRTWQCDKSSLESISFAIMSVELGIKQLPKFWRDLNNENFEIRSTEELKELACEMHERYDQITYKKFDFKDKIDNAKTSDELNLISVEIGKI